jgi:hypothetical protein
MSERLETLKKARARMIEDRDMHAKVLAAPFDRDKAERARSKFIEIQALIDGLDRAINGEEIISSKKAEPVRRRDARTFHDANGRKVRTSPAALMTAPSPTLSNPRAKGTAANVRDGSWLRDNVLMRSAPARDRSPQSDTADLSTFFCWTIRTPLVIVWNAGQGLRRTQWRLRWRV